MGWECGTCVKHIYHDGKCQGKNSYPPCLIYEKDPRGVKKYLDNIKFEIPFHIEIPKIGEPSTIWTLDGISKTLNFTRINKVEWHTNAKGLQGVRFWADLWYWSDENGELPEKKKKPKLVLVK